MSLRVVEPGWCTLVVDLGRPATRSLGVPVGGAADRTALALGNALVGNDPAAAALECSLAGPTLVAGGPLAGVVFGAPFEVAKNGVHIPIAKTFTLRPDDELAIGGTARGVRAYLCVRGGIQAPLILESRSSLEPLYRGAVLPCEPGSIRSRFLDLESETRHSPASILSRFVFTPRSAPHVVRVLEGPQAAWFQNDEFYGQGWSVAPASNRMGLRLQAKPLTVPDRELVSEPVCPGTVQVTRDGQCIVLGVDGQTIGGYPKIAQVISADVDALGQLRPGDKLRFLPLSLGEAEAIFRNQQDELRNWILRLRASCPPP